jgi:hypothetical protein
MEETSLSSDRGSAELLGKKRRFVRKRSQARSPQAASGLRVRVRARAQAGRQACNALDPAAHSAGSRALSRGSGGQLLVGARTPHVEGTLSRYISLCY